MNVKNEQWWYEKCMSLCVIWYGVATISRMLKNIGLFCKRDLQKRPIFCKETYIFKHPTHRSHPIFLITHYITNETYPHVYVWVCFVCKMHYICVSMSCLCVIKITRVWWRMTYVWVCFVCKVHYICVSMSCLCNKDYTGMTHDTHVSMCPVWYAVHMYEALHLADVIRITYVWVCVLCNNLHYKCVSVCPMGWLRVAGSLKLYVCFAEYRFFYRSLLQLRPIILRSLLFAATPYIICITCVWVCLAYLIHITYSGRLLRHLRHAYVISMTHSHIYLAYCIKTCVCVCNRQDMCVYVCNRLTCQKHT